MMSILRRSRSVVPLLAFLSAASGLFEIYAASALPQAESVTQSTSVRLVATPSQRFIDAIGVNTHLSWVDTAWGDWDQVARELDYLGISLVRDGIPYLGWTMPAYESLARAGIRFTILLSGPDIDIPGDLKSIAALEAAHPGSVYAVEGPNEFNVNRLRFEGRNSFDDPAWGGPVNAALRRALAENPVLGNVKLVSASLANADLADVLAMGDQSESVDAGNWHVYFSKGDQPRENIRSGIALAKRMARSDPVHITETGYYTAVDAMDWGGGGVAQDVQAKLTLNLLLDAYQAGAEATVLYELQDNIANPASDDLENSFGLFRGDGTPKLAATAIRNLVSHLAPVGKGDAGPEGLDLTLTGLPATADRLLLRRGPGRFSLIVWNEPDLWDQGSRSAIPIDPMPIGIALAVPAKLIVFDPVAGEGPIQTGESRSSLTISLADSPLIVDIALELSASQGL